VLKPAAGEWKLFVRNTGDFLKKESVQKENCKT
jgi:hypothetical protein